MFLRNFDLLLLGLDRDLIVMLLILIVLVVFATHLGGFIFNYLFFNWLRSIPILVIFFVFGVLSVLLL